MRTIIFLFFTVTIFYSCKTELQSSEEFVLEFFDYVQKEDSEALYDKCYISSKSEIRKMMQEFSRSKDVDGKSVNRMYEAAKEDKNRLASRIKIPFQSDSVIQLDSIINSPQKIMGIGGDFEPNEGVRLDNLSAYINVDDIRYKIIFQCVDLKSGKWKIARHPKITKLD